MSNNSDVLAKGLLERIGMENADVYRLYDFLMETIKVWHPASRRWSEQ